MQSIKLNYFRYLKVRRFDLIICDNSADNNGQDIHKDYWEFISTIFNGF